MWVARSLKGTFQLCICILKDNEPWCECGKFILLKDQGEQNDDSNRMILTWFSSFKCLPKTRVCALYEMGYIVDKKNKGILEIWQGIEYAKLTHIRTTLASIISDLCYAIGLCK